MKSTHTADTESSMDQARLGFKKRNKEIEDEMKSVARKQKGSAPGGC